MKITSNLKKVVHWGPRGVLNYVKGLSHRCAVGTFLLDSCRRQSPKKGFTLIGEFAQFGSHAKVMRDLAAFLKDANIPYQTFDTSANPSPILQREAAEYLTPRNSFSANRFDHIVEILPSIVPDRIKIPRARIAFWEFESGFLYGYPDMPQEARVVAMSDFNLSYFRRELPQSVAVSKILYPFRCEKAAPPPRNEVRRGLGLNQKDFVVLFNFDYGSGFSRKNPNGALRAFATAFSAQSDAHFVLKTKSAARHPDRVRELQQLAVNLGIGNRVAFIDQTLSQRDLFGIVNACDVYLSLHRGEGFGITLAEAMAMGKPVVCTDWSSTTEFCTPDCTLPVPFKMVAVRPEQVDNPYYREVKEWAEPDVDAAAAALRRLHDEPGLRDELGRKAAASIREQFSNENFRKSAEAFLNS